MIIKTEGKGEIQSFFQGHRRCGRKAVIFPGRTCYFWSKPGYNLSSIVVEPTKNISAQIFEKKLRAASLSTQWKLRAFQVRICIPSEDVHFQ